MTIPEHSAKTGRSAAKILQVAILPRLLFSQDLAWLQFFFNVLLMLWHSCYSILGIELLRIAYF